MNHDKILYIRDKEKSQKHFQRTEKAKQNKITEAIYKGKRSRISC